MMQMKNHDISNGLLEYILDANLMSKPNWLIWLFSLLKFFVFWVIFAFLKKKSAQKTKTTYMNMLEAASSILNSVLNFLTFRQLKISENSKRSASWWCIFKHVQLSCLAFLSRFLVQNCKNESEHKEFQQRKMQNQPTWLRHEICI